MVVVVLVVTVAAPARAQWAATAYVDNNVAGDVQSGRLGLGVSAGYYVRGWIGFELDAELHGHFFRDEDVAYLAQPGVDLDTRALIASGNVVFPYCLRGAAGTWCPYATAGLGLIRPTFEGMAHQPGAEGFVRTQTNLALNGGVGVTHALTPLVGFRVDARYLRAFADEDSTGVGYFEDYGYCRVSVGIIFGGPQSGEPSP
jgi:hypothetical protein